MEYEARIDAHGMVTIVGCSFASGLTQVDLWKQFIVVPNKSGHTVFRVQSVNTTMGILKRVADLPGLRTQS